MIAGLHALIVRASSSARGVGATVACFAGCFVLLQLTAAWFRSASGGLEPLDLQGLVGRSEVEEQVASWSSATRDAATAFVAVDTVFPFVGAMVAAVVTAACLASAAPELHARLLERRLLLLAFVPTLLDWLENVAVLGLARTSWSGWTEVFVVAHTLKMLSLALVLAVVVGSCAAWLVVRVRRRRAPA